MFKCDEFKDVKTSFMRADYSLVCQKKGETPADRAGWVAYAIIMIFIYPIGIPLMYSVLLWREHEQLCPALVENPSLPMKSKLWYLFIRRSELGDDTEPQSENSMLDFLVSSYEPKAFWFEVVECFRRLLLSSMLILVADGSAAQVVTAMIICLFSIKVYSYYSPFAVEKDDILAEVAQWQLFFVFFAALMIRVNATGDSTSDQAALAGLLIFVTSVGFVLMIVLSVDNVWDTVKEDDSAAGLFKPSIFGVWDANDEEREEKTIQNGL